MPTGRTCNRSWLASISLDGWRAGWRRPHAASIRNRSTTRTCESETQNRGHMEAFNAAAWLVDRQVGDGRGDRLAIRCQGRSTTYAALQQELWRAQHLLAA